MTSLDLTDPYELTACALEDYAAAWATRLMLPSEHFARRDGEPDVFYRPRLLDMIYAAQAR